MTLPLYTLKRNARSRSVRIKITRDGKCVVTAPKRVPVWMVERFVKEKEAWINAHVLKAKNRTPNILESGTKADYLRLKDKALRLAQMHLDHFNAIYKLTYKKISIRNQKTRWGSCSSTGTLSFNYRIVHLSPEAQDYIIVHELCHVAQMNHSAKFWRLVEKTIPDYRKICTAIRQ